MFTHRKINETNERGALMIEAIALLGLMTMMSPMVVRQTADRSSEMQEVTVAGQMKELRDALNNWIAANYGTLANSIQATDIEHKFIVNASDLAPFLSAASLDEGAFRGNKLVTGFDVGVFAQCTEMRYQDGTPCVPGTCYTLANGIVDNAAADGHAIGNGKICSRYRMSGIVLSNGPEIEDRRASRIATMIGADGGYTRTQTMLNTFAGEDLDEESRRVLGSQGVWEGDMDDYFGTPLANPTGRIAVTTNYSSGLSGDFLYRKQVAGMPDANSMFTDLDMGGNTACQGDACHNINNAGGLEVIGGRILIRSRNNAMGGDDQAVNDGGEDFAQIALGLDNSHINVTESLNLNAGADTSHLEMNNNSATLSADNSSLELGTNNVSLAAGDTSSLELGQNSATLAIDGGASLALTDTTATTTAGNATTTLTDGSATTTVGENVSMEMDANTLTATAHNATMTLANNSAQTSVGNVNMSLNSGANNGGAYLSAGGAEVSATYTENDRQVGIYADEAQFVAHTSNNEGNRVFSRVKIGDNSAFSGLFTRNNETVAATRIYGTDGGPEVFGEAGSHTLADYSLRVADNQHGLFSVHVKNGEADATTHKRMVFDARNGLRLYTAAGANPNENVPEDHHATIQLDPDRGEISGGVFTAGVIKNNGDVHDRMILKGAGEWTEVVQSRIRLAVDEETGQTSSGDTTTLINDGGGAKGGSDAFVFINTGALGGSSQLPYQTHYEHDKTYYRSYRVDPAFVSVMNDIKLTSRGGARLSEALSNYILKGIYVLSNSFSAGGWPCVDNEHGGGNTCSFKMPYYKNEQLGVTLGATEFNCYDGNHPVTEGQGLCEEHADKYVQFDLNRTTGGNQYNSGEYSECPDGKTCWAHPFMGKIPAPGRTIMTKIIHPDSEERYLRAQDEGICPDGYQAVLTVTPNSFEMGKLLMLNTDPYAPAAGEAIIRYNFGYLDFEEDGAKDITVMLQTGTRLGISTQPELENGQIKGWRIAMGTVTPIGSGEHDYIWNFGGVPTNSWTAIAHTYCYFNPDRFVMPNMQFMNEGNETERVLNSMDNPLLSSNPDAFH